SCRVLLTPAQYVQKAIAFQHAAQRMPREFVARQTRARQPAQEACPLPRMPQGCRRCGAQRAECVSGEHRIERWPRCGWREDCRLASLAERTVATGAAVLS